MFLRNSWKATTAHSVSMNDAQYISTWVSNVILKPEMGFGAQPIWLPTVHCVQLLSLSFFIHFFFFFIFVCQQHQLCQRFWPSPSLCLRVRPFRDSSLAQGAGLPRLAKDSSPLLLFLSVCPACSALDPRALSSATGWALLHMTCPFARSALPLLVKTSAPQPQSALADATKTGRGSGEERHTVR